MAQRRTITQRRSDIILDVSAYDGRCIGGAGDRVGGQRVQCAGGEGAVVLASDGVGDCVEGACVESIQPSMNLITFVIATDPVIDMQSHLGLQTTAP